MQKSKFYDKPAEKAVITYLLVGKRQEEIFSELPAEDYFWDDFYRKTYAVALELKEKGKRVDYVSLASKVNPGLLLDVIMTTGDPLIVEVMLDHDSFLTSCQTIRECWTRRAIYLNIQEGKDLEAIRGNLDKLTRSRGRHFSASQLADLYFDVVHVSEAEKAKTTFPFRLLNNATMGLRPGQYVIVAARPSVGKSAFLENCAFWAAERGARVLFASAEMDAESIGTRIMTRLTGIDLFRRKPQGEEELAKHSRALDRLNRLSKQFEVFQQGPMRTGDLEKEIKGEKYDLVCVDYLSLFEPNHDYRSLYEKTTFVSAELKALANKYQAAFLVASQYNRLAANVQPDLSNLRESGALEQDADIVISLWKEKADAASGDAVKIRLDLLKNRNGWTFSNSSHKEYFLWFVPKRTQFSDPLGINRALKEGK